MEAGESPKEAIRRELQEEIEFSPKKLSLVKTYDWPEKTEYIFHTIAEIDVSTTPLHEGQRLSWFSPTAIKSMRLAFHDNQILDDFLNSRK